MKFQITISFLIALLLTQSLQAQEVDNAANELRIKVELLSNTTNLRLQGEVICCTVAIPQFYNSQLFQSIWNKQMASDLIEVIIESEAEGLNPMDYHLNQLQILNTKDLTTYEEIDFEILLTDVFLLYTSHIMSGKVDPQKIDSDWKVSRREGNPVKVLETVMQNGDVKGEVNKIKPSFKAYNRLKERLALYRKIQEDGGWSIIPAGETIKLDMRDARVELLRTRLKVTEDLKAYTFDEPELFDETIQKAVKIYQKRNGLEVDGNLGKETLASLNIPVEKRIEQIRINLDRCRWLPQDLGKKYVMVNLPAYELEVVNEGKVDMEMTVAVGKPFRQTPVFSAKMTYLVFNPYWTVPPTILSQDMIPAQAKNPEHLNKLNIKVIASDGTIVNPSTIDWTTITPGKFPYILRQEPGANNALGEVKFIFPNPYNVYMHDTNHRELFVKTDRALSSGCVRLSNPRGMAQYILEKDNNWTSDKISGILKLEQNYSVILKEPIMVHMQYWTSFIDENGILNFRKDIYNRDQKVLNALNEKPLQ